MKFFYYLMLILSPVFLFGEDKVEKSGPIILVGGGVIPKDAIQWMKGKAKTGKFVVITLHKDRCDRWKEFFGEPEIYHPDELKDCDDIGGLIIDGGDQWQYVTKLDGKIVSKFHKKGVPILGTSAGSMILGEYYFSAEQDSITSEEAEKGERVCIGKDFVVIESLRNTFVESHYKERNRQGRLKVFMKKSGATRGLGIDESTALCIDENGTHTTFGEGGVEVVSMEH